MVVVKRAGRVKGFVTGAVRAGALAAGVLVAWGFFHGFARMTRVVVGEFRDSQVWEQLGVGTAGD